MYDVELYCCTKSLSATIQKTKNYQYRGFEGNCLRCFGGKGESLSNSQKLQVK